MLRVPKDVTETDVLAAPIFFEEHDH